MVTERTRDQVWPGMSSADWARLSRYAAGMADEMGLRDWTIKIEGQHVDGDDGAAMAETRVTYGRKVAVVRFCHDFAELTPEEQRHTVVHELLHCHLDQVATPVENGLEQLIGRPAYTVLFEHVRVAIELAVDAITDVLEPHLPLPPAAG